MARFVVLLCACLGCAMAWLLVSVSSGQAAEAPEKRLSLPKPDISGGKPLMEALALRKSTRAFSDKPVSQRDLSNLLWAAWGVNRADGKRTVPTANNRQEVSLYVAMDNGVWLYDAQKNELALALDMDARYKFGGGPLILLYVALADSRYSGMHVGSMYQNAGLYCASAGLGNVVKAQKADALDGVLKLPGGYKVMIIQVVGVPK